MLFHIVNKVLKIENSAKFIIRHLALVLFFTILYFLTERLFTQKRKKNDIKDPMSLLECFHFSLVTQTTVGYGHAYPTNIYSRIINMVQLLTIYGVFIFDI